MKRTQGILAIAVVIALVAVFAVFAAVETTTVSGKVVLPNGATATGGTVTAVLSQPGSTPDGATSQAVGGRTSGTIAADGSVSLTLVPNDAITPVGTYYDVRVTTTGPVAATWTEKWSVTTSPDPVNVGAITRLEVAPGLVVGAFVQYVSVEPSGACVAADTPRVATATNRYCECESATWACTAVGGMSEGQLTGTSRTYTVRQTFDVIGVPACTADPPVGACTTKDLCVDDTNKNIYLCIASAWQLVGRSGLDETALTGTTRVFTAEQTFRQLKLEADPPLAVPVLRTAAPAFEFWTGTGFSPQTTTQDIGATRPYRDAYVQRLKPSLEILPTSDNTVEAGSSSFRLSEVHARELRGFCPGGPTGAAGAGICYDPDDPLGPAFKAMVGGQVLYVQVSATHP